MSLRRVGEFLRQPTVVLTIVIGVGLAMSLAYAFAIAGGPRVGGDSSRYIDGGAQLFAGGDLSGRALSYVGYIAVVGVVQTIGLGLTGIVVLQSLVAAVAAVALFDLSRRLAGPWAGVAAAVLFLFFFDLLRWHRYILTDSLFISFVVFAVWAVHYASERASPAWHVAALVPLACAALIRPNGWLLVPVACAYWTWRGSRSPRLRWGASLVVLVALFALVPLTPAFQAQVSHEQPGEQIQEGHVIWGVRETWIDMPASDVQDTGLGGVVRYAVEHPVATVRLMGLRAGWELVNVRPYYSTPHNLYIAAHLIPIYIFAALGLVRARHRPLAWLLASVFAVNVAFVAVTFADYDGRFLMYALPMLMALAGVGFTEALRLLRRTRQDRGRAELLSS